MFARALKVLVDGVALATAAAIALAHPTSAQAHRRVEVAPAVGAYLPTGNLQLGTAFRICVPDPSNPDNCLPFSMRAKQAVAVGSRVTAWLSNRGAIEGSFWYSPSRVVSGYIPVGSSEQAGSFVAAALRFVLSLAPHAPAMSALVMGGPAMVHRSLAPGNGTTSFGGALGFALDMRPKRHLGVRAQIEDYLYSPHAQYGPREMRQDFVLSLSISPFGQRGERQ
jgi:hypothetical protein